MDGIYNSKSIKTIVGDRLRKARKDFDPELSREDVCNKVNTLHDEDNYKTLHSETLKQWELGKNPMSIDRLQDICKVLDCDPGYLFGVYEEKKYSLAKECEKTGLSEKAVARLQQIRKYEDTVHGGAKLMLLNAILEDDNFLEHVANALYSLHMIPEQSIIEISFHTEQGNRNIQSLYSDNSDDLRRLYLADLQNIIFRFIESQFHI